MVIEVFKVKYHLSNFIMRDDFQGENAKVTTCLQTDFQLPNIKTVSKGENPLRHLGPLIQKTVPNKLKNMICLKSFKVEIKKKRYQKTVLVDYGKYP